jgi:hypothetical protein
MRLFKNGQTNQISKFHLQISSQNWQKILTARLLHYIHIYVLTA